MNVINLKTLSLSALLTSTMLCGAFAMEKEIDSSSPIRSVKDAAAKFQTPEKVDTSKIKINFQEDLKNANGGGIEFLQNKKQIKEDAEAQSQNLKQKIVEMGSKILERETELSRLQGQISGLENEIQAYSKHVLMTKDWLHASTYRPVKFVSSLIWGSGETSTNVNTNNANAEAPKETPNTQPKYAMGLVLEENNTNAGNKIFDAELAAVKEDENAKYVELHEKVATLETAITTAIAELEKKQAEHAKAKEQFAKDQANALITKDSPIISRIYGTPPKK